MVWLPFELHPEVPLEGMLRDAAFSGERYERARAHMRDMAAELGLTMVSSDRRINTRLALAAAEFAREQGDDTFRAMHHALFKAHWEQTGRLDSIADLVAIGTACGLDGDALEAALRDGRYEATLDANRREATTVGINAIPAHIFGRQYLVLGAQPEDVFRKVIAELNGNGEDKSEPRAE